MKSQQQDTKAKSAKIESMKKIRAAYLNAKANGQVKTYNVQPV
jgi:hypothetical protein